MMTETLESALRGCVDQYEEAMDKVIARLRPGDGLLGLGRDPKRDPCHMAFYEAVGETVARFAGEELAAEEAFQAARFLLSLTQVERRNLVRPMMEAVQGHALPLIPLLEPGQAEELAHWYGAHYPKRQRLPVQDKVMRALEKRARG